MRNTNDADFPASITTPSPGNGQSAQTTTLYYDKSLRTTNTVQPDQTSVLASFYPSGLTRQQSGSRTYPVGYSYDAQNRLKTMTNWSSFPSAGARVTTWNYDSQRGWLTGKQYPLPSGEGQGEGPSYGYTPAGRLSTRTSPRTLSGLGENIVTTSGYNYAGQLSSIEYSDTTPSVAFTHDRLGRISQISNPTSQITRAYDHSGNLLSESYTGGPLDGLTLTNQYDQFNRRTNLSLHQSSNPLIHQSFSFSPVSGRLQTVTDGTNSATYSYVANSALVEHIFFTNNNALRMTATKQWDSLNRLEGISSAYSAYSAVGFSYGYNAANQRTNALLADGSSWLFAYDSLGQVTTGSKRWPDKTPVAGQQFGYSFDDIGNRLSTINNTHVAAYTNNLLNQITSRDIPGFAHVIGSANSNATVSLWADNGAYTQTSRKGNYFFGELSVNNAPGAVWLAVTNLAVLRNGTNADYVASSVGRTLIPQTPEHFTYDEDGNLTSDGLWTNVWNAENRRIRVESTENIPPTARLREQWTYLPDGRWIERIVSTNDGSAYIAAWTNRYVWDGNVLLAVLNGNNELELAFMRGLDLSGTLQGAGGVGGLLAVRVGPAGAPSLANTVHFAVNDGNGNVTALMDATTGAVTARYEYGPFAEPVRQTGPMAKLNPIRFSTQYADDLTGDIKYLFRDYTPLAGGWSSRDPIGEKGGFNLYGFVGNAPLNRNDKFGLMMRSTDPSVEVFIGAVYGLCKCKAKMEKAKAAAFNVQASFQSSYICDVDGDQLTPNEAIPGNGLAHCLAGYYAKDFGASKTCLALANAYLEGEEFLTLSEWWFWHEGKFSLLQTERWKYDTFRDVGWTFYGYWQKSPEGCLPSNCRKRSGGL